MSLPVSARPWSLVVAAADSASPTRLRIMSRSPTNAPITVPVEAKVSGANWVSRISWEKSVPGSTSRPWTTTSSEESVSSRAWPSQPWAEQVFCAGPSMTWACRTTV